MGMVLGFKKDLKSVACTPAESTDCIFWDIPLQTECPAVVKWIQHIKILVNKYVHKLSNWFWLGF